MNPCSCPLHRLSKEDIDSAIDETVAEAQAIETVLDDLTKEIVDGIEEDLEIEL